MNNNIFDEMRRAVILARDTLDAADATATDAAWLLKNRLRHVSNIYTLRALKRELRDFDMTTGQWK